jgi:hypothetical protein
MPKIISTLTDSVEYTQYHNGEDGGVPTPIKSVLVKGGANLAQKKLVILGEGETSVPGVETEVTDEELAFLQDHPLFQTHAKNGFVQAVKSSNAKAADVAKDMARDKASAQITEEDTDVKNPDARLKGHKLKGTKE